MATANTPKCTEATIRTVLQYNAGVEMKWFIAAPKTSKKWLDPIIKHIPVHEIFYTEKVLNHSYLLDYLWKKGYSEHVLTLDSDITILGENVINEFIEKVDAHPSFGGCKLGAYTEEEHLVVIPGNAPEPWYIKDFNFQKGSGIWFCVWKRSIADRFVKQFGFFESAQSGFGKGKYYDVGVLLEYIMEVNGHPVVEFGDDERIHHWQSVSWIKDRYGALEPAFDQIIKDHPWKK